MHVMSFKIELIILCTSKRIDILFAKLVKMTNAVALINVIPC